MGGGNYGQPAGHGLDDDLSKAFEIAGKYEYIGLVQKCGAVCRGNEPAQFYSCGQAIAGRKRPVASNDQPCMRPGGMKLLPYTA
jgi:hypothetical protein